MTTVVTLENLPSASPIDVSVLSLDQTKLVLQATEKLANGGIRSEYVYNDGDPNVDTTVSYQVIPDIKKGTVRTSVRIATTQVVTVDSVETERAPFECTIFWINPGRSEDPGKILDAIGTLYSLTFDGVTTKVPNEGTIGLLNRQVTEVI